MKTSNVIILLLVVAIVAVGAWFLFFRKKPAQAQGLTSGFSSGYRPPLGVAGGKKPSGGSGLNRGIELAATTGCAAAAAVYSGGAAMPLCGLAGPLTVGAKDVAVGGAKAVGKFFSKLF